MDAYVTQGKGSTTMSTTSITGQLFFRDAGIKKVSKHLYMVVGILGFPEGLTPPNEHQLVVQGDPFMWPQSYALMVHKDNAVDLTEMAKGLPAGHLLTEPVWRI